MKGKLFLFALLFSSALWGQENRIGDNTRTITAQKFKANNASGTGTRLLTTDNTGLFGPLGNGSNGQILTMVSGAPAWATLSGETDPTVGAHIKAISTGDISNWNAAYSWGNHAGLYAPIGRTLTINGVAQTLAADRTWTIPTIYSSNGQLNGHRTISGNFKGFQIDSALNFVILAKNQSTTARSVNFYLDGTSLGDRVVAQTQATFDGYNYDNYMQMDGIVGSRLHMWLTTPLGVRRGIKFEQKDGAFGYTALYGRMPTSTASTDSILVKASMGDAGQPGELRLIAKADFATSAGFTTLYSGNGTIAANRAVDVNQKSLDFNNGLSYNFFTWQASANRSGYVKGAVDNWVMGVDNNDSLANVYTQSGGSKRTAAGFLAWKGVTQTQFVVEPGKIYMDNGADSLDLYAYKLRKGTGSNVVYYSPTTGKFTYDAAGGASGVPTIYTTDAPVAGDRIVYGNSQTNWQNATLAQKFNLSFLGFERIEHEASSAGKFSKMVIMKDSAYIGNRTGNTMADILMQQKSNLFGSVTISGGWFDNITSGNGHQLEVRDNGIWLQSYFWQTGVDMHLYTKNLTSGTSTKVLYYNPVTFEITQGDPSGAGGTGADGNNYPTALSWVPTTGALTIQRNGLAQLQVNLDGRYALQSSIQPDQNNYVTSIALDPTSHIFTLSRSGLGALTLDMSSLVGAGGGAGTTIYTGNGTINSARVVDVNANTLNWNNAASFTIGTTTHVSGLSSGVSIFPTSTGLITSSAAAQAGVNTVTYADQGVSAVMTAADITNDKEHIFYVSPKEIMMQKARSSANLTLKLQSLPAKGSETNVLFYDPATGQVKYGASTGGADGNNYPTAMSFNATSNVLSLSRNGLTDVTVDLTALKTSSGLVLNAGSYTPTISNTVGDIIGSVTPATCYWTRVGDYITVYGEVTFWADIHSVSVGFDMSLPIATNLVDDASLHGLGNSFDAASDPMYVSGNGATETAKVVATRTGAGSRKYKFSFQYKL